MEDANSSIRGLFVAGLGHQCRPGKLLEGNSILLEGNLNLLEENLFFLQANFDSLGGNSICKASS
jgi:hypothetical protein